MTWVYDDGGRKAAGYKGEADDCTTRAIAIATGLSYQAAYDLVNEAGRTERKSKNRKGRGSARTGIYAQTIRRMLAKLGWQWTPTMHIGSGCKVHLRADELPDGNLIVAVSKHTVAVIDGVVHDTHDSTREGRRCVYGYWKRGAA